MNKIMADPYGFAREAEPEKVSRDYSAELVRKLINDEAEARDAEDDVLRNRIAAEEHARSAKDEELKAEIDAEAEARAAADSVLDGKIYEEVDLREQEINRVSVEIDNARKDIESEAEARSAKDTELDGKIADEAKAREAVYTELKAEILSTASGGNVRDEMLKADIETEADARSTKDAELQAEIEKKADKKTAEGGFAGGDGASVAGGGAVGLQTVTGHGGAVGYLAKSSAGGAIGREARAEYGGAVGYLAKAGHGFAGGYGARATDGTKYDFNAIQLGTGTNSNSRTLQVYDYQLMDADGNIPNERMPSKVDKVEGMGLSSNDYTDEDLWKVRDLDMILSLKADVDYVNDQIKQSDATKADKIRILDDHGMVSDITYDFSIFNNVEYRNWYINSFSFDFPDGVYPEDYISGLSFSTGETAPEISYTNTGILNWVGTDCSLSEGLSIFTPRANMQYDIVFYFNSSSFVGVVNGFVPAIGNGVTA